MYIYGKNPIKDLVDQKPELIKKIYIDRKKHQSFYDQLLKKNYPVELLKEINYQKIFQNINIQGIIAEIKEPCFLEFEQFIIDSKFLEEDTILILDKINDPQNLGSIFRNAVAFGIKTVILTEHNSAPITATAIKASAGTWFKLNLISVSSIGSTIEKLKKNEYWLISTSLDGQEELEKIKDFKKKAIILGNEGKGVRKSLQDKADLNLKIKMSSNLDSLNVSAAAAIILYTNYK